MSQLTFATATATGDYGVGTPSGRSPEGKARQGLGFCAKHGLEHAWENGPTFTVNPPIYTRSCVNCGQGQRMFPSQWQDWPLPKPDEKDHA